jgi:hypothetical protein
MSSQSNLKTAEKDALVLTDMTPSATLCPHIMAMKLEL